ncbi:hypothetical protein SASPL_120287 [Salvia splendens]|uniref:HMA domain-containing protein n=1 Tax=Salvia splendens TaxID=180675 RepID=A0A8X8XQI9_SALSN|nr:hypothetical protein SASPL_120287 [Salvia splendens]
MQKKFVYKYIYVYYFRKLSISNQKCRIGFLKAVAKLTGVDVLKVDAEKGKITVATAIRKAGYSDERWTTKETRSQT